MSPLFFRMKKLVFYFLLLPFSIPLLWAQSTIEGVVIDTDFGDILPFANVVLLDQNNGNAIVEGSTTDFDGKFSFTDLPVGTYTLEVSYVGYANTQITDILADGVSVITLDVNVSPATDQLEEVIVTTTQKRNNESAVLSIQKNAAVVLDGLSVQAIRRAGDGNIAAAVKRVPGVSIQDGKYVYVRGLGDRYSKTLVNGMEIPGLDPDKNTLQMDIFPTNLIDNIQVLKSGNAAYDADFSGGIVNLMLKDFSSSPAHTLTLGFEFNPSMHFKDNYIYDEGSKTDVFGFDNGYRKFPFSRGIDIPLPEVGDFRSSIVTTYTESLDKNMEVSEKTSSPGISLGFSSSNTYNLDEERKIGYIAALNYRSKISFFEDYVESRYEKSAPAFANVANNSGRLATDERFISFLSGLALGTSNSKYKLNFLFIQNGESNATDGRFENLGENNYEGVGEVKSYVQRQIMSIPLSTKHYFNEGDVELNLSFNPTFSRVYDKDFKLSIFNQEGEDYTISNNGAGLPIRIWRYLNETSYNGRANLIFKHDLGGVQAETSVGGFFLAKNRSFETEFFTLDYLGDSRTLNGQANNILASNNIWTMNDPQGAYVYGTFQEENQFDSKVMKFGGYISEEINISPALKTYLGLRFENYRIFYTGESIDKIAYKEEKFIDTSDLFPSVNVIYSLNEEKKVRFSYYRTTARPSFKENSAAIIFDPITFNRFFGNTAIQPTFVSNFDVRYEKYPEKGGFFALSGFYKKFKNPIEIVFYQGNSRQFRPENSEQADVYGIEFELRKKLYDNNVYSLGFNLNTSLIESRQKLTGLERIDREFDANTLGKEFKDYRALQGQSPYIVNTSLVYKRGESEVSLFYNVQGETLVFVGNFEVSDVYSVPFHGLNLVAKRTFGAGKNQSLQLEIQNLLNQNREIEYQFFDIQPELFSQRKIGTTFALTYRANL